MYLFSLQVFQPVEMNRNHFVQNNIYCLMLRLGYKLIIVH